MKIDPHEVAYSHISGAFFWQLSHSFSTLTSRNSKTLISPKLDLLSHLRSGGSTKKRNGKPSPLATFGRPQFDRVECQKLRESEGFHRQSFDCRPFREGQMSKTGEKLRFSASEAPPLRQKAIEKKSKKGKKRERKRKEKKRERERKREDKRRS